MVRLSKISSKNIESIGGPSWLSQFRLDALGELDSCEFPSAADELWRYSKIDDLDLEAIAPSWVPPEVNLTERLEYFAGVDKPAARLLVVNGCLVDGWVHESALAKGLAIGCYGTAGSRIYRPDGSLGENETSGQIDELAKTYLGKIARSNDTVDLIAQAIIQDLIVIVIPESLELTGPVLIEHIQSAEIGGGSEFSVSSPRTLVIAGENSKVSIIQALTSPTWEPSHLRLLTLPTEEIAVGDGASVDYISIQDLGLKAWQIAHQVSEVGRDARFCSFSVALGGDYARQRTDSRAAGTGCETNLLAAYFARGNQMHDFRTLQDHVAPRTYSHLYFKGAVDDNAESVYSGLIRVEKGASKSNAFQENRNLVLSQGAHAESVPNLDIQENDVRCSHASTVGPIDPEQRYYLESRGITPKEADQLIVEGFFDDIFSRVESLVPVRQLVRRKIAAKQNEMFFVKEAAND